MMVVKKFLCCVLTMLMLLAMLVGCGSSANSGETAVQDNADVDAFKPKVERVEMTTVELAEYVQKRTVTITVNLKDGGTSVGSGFFVDDKGTIVTSYHVIDAADSISAEISDGGKYDVKTIVDFSEIYDVAVLQIDYSGNDYLTCVEENCRTGETVYAVGSSLGTLTGTFSDGIVSSNSRVVGVIDCVQTTAAISKGNSGGPLVNIYGEVIGINAFSYVSGENLNLAVTIDTLDRLSMDKNWSMTQYREWYKKEIDRSYNVWNYSTELYELSKINTYQHVTGSNCLYSYKDWKFLDGYYYNNRANGYDSSYGIFCYAYNVQSMDTYTEYLKSIGFDFVDSEDFEQGTSYYYENEFNGFMVDIFTYTDRNGEEFIVIEPYTN